MWKKVLRVENRNKGIGKMVISLVALMAVIMILRALDFDRSWFSQEKIESFGVYAPLVFIGLMIVAVVLAVPGGPMSALAGVLFGSVQGVICISIGSSIGAAIAFLVARYAARDFIQARLGANPSYMKLDSIVKKRGYLIIAIVRLVPLFPFNLVNYGMGLTSIPFWEYFFLSWLCMLPGTTLYVVGGDAIKKAIVSGQVPVGLVGIFVALLVALIVFSKIIKKKF